jgi:hypothetical protein
MVEQLRHEQAMSPREQVARARRLLRRGLKFWRGSLLLLLAGGAGAIGVASQVPRVYRSECTIFAKARIRTDDRDDSATSPDAIARQSARLKDMLTTRGRLESAIRKYHLYPETIASRTMLDAAEQMKPHVGFRALEGGQFVISFDGGDPDTVKDVTGYLSESLITDYASGDLQDVQREADFLAHEEEGSLASLEEATKALTIFLADHPEFALEAKQAATTPFGPSATAGIPLLPTIGRAAAVPADPELAALYRERARLAGEARGTTAAANNEALVGVSSRSADDPVAQAQGDLEAAAKRVAETQGDLASKSNLTEDHPDMRAARMAAESAARQLHEAKVRLAALQRLRSTGTQAGAPPLVSSDVKNKIRQVDAQIGARRAQLARAAPAGSAPGRSGAGPANPAVSAAVQLETDWQRLLRALSEAKSHHEDLKTRAQRAKLATEAARSEARERMAMVDPPFRPSHPAKGGRMNTGLAGVALAWLLAIAYATARAALDDTIVEALDVEMLAHAKLLGVVPKLEPLGLTPPSGKATEDAAA